MGERVGGRVDTYLIKTLQCETESLGGVVDRLQVVAGWELAYGKGSGKVATTRHLEAIVSQHTNFLPIELGPGRLRIFLCQKVI